MQLKSSVKDKKQIQSKKFFLILSCSGGNGHIRAAEALHSTASILNLPIYTKHYNVLDFTTKFFKNLYSESYLQLVNKIPELYGYLYNQSERKYYKKNSLLKSFDQINYKKYLKFLKSLKPNAIICTHFLPYISVSNQLKKENLQCPIFAVTTDFDVHQLWIDPIVKRYYVFHDESAWQLNAKGVELDKIKITGIPIMPEFKHKETKSLVLNKLGVKKECFTILFLSGGFGVGRLKEIVEYTISLLSDYSGKEFNLLIVCGNNERAKLEIQKIKFPKNTYPYIYGFVNNINLLMDAADILISKAGGLTCSEALAKSLPILIIDPIPGQESRNADLIVEHGAGWKAINLANLLYKLKLILDNPSILKKARKATSTLAKPNSAENILKDVFYYIRN